MLDTHHIPLADIAIEGKIIATVAIAMAMIALWFHRISDFDKAHFWWLRDPVHRRHTNLTENGELNTRARIVLLVAAGITLLIVWLA